MFTWTTSHVLLSAQGKELLHKHMQTCPMALGKVRLNLYPGQCYNSQGLGKTLGPSPMDRLYVKLAFLVPWPKRPGLYCTCLCVIWLMCFRFRACPLLLLFSFWIWRRLMPSLPSPTSLINHARWPSSEWTMTWYAYTASSSNLFVVDCIQHPK